jgi:hypothetical protein
VLRGENLTARYATMKNVEAASADEEGPGLPWGALAPHNQARLAEIVAVQIPEVFRANRVIEQQTGYASEIGKTMMVDVLSHLATLAQRGGELTDVQQASQLSKIEEHLRRSIIEHPEEVLRNRIVDVEERWRVYQREAFPYREKGTLPNAPRHQELEEIRNRIRLLLETARSKKPDETTWEESLDAAAEMTQAAHLAGELLDKLEQCIGAAQERRHTDQREAGNKRRSAIAIVVSILLAVGGFVGGLIVANHGDKKSDGQQAPVGKQK